jgi:hypothetical protein
MAPPPAAGPGVDLGGTRVPRDKAIVVVHFGHSNMAAVAVAAQGELEAGLRL